MNMIAPRRSPNWKKARASDMESRVSVGERNNHKRKKRWPPQVERMGLATVERR